MSKFIIIMGLALAIVACKPPANPDITLEEIQAHLEFMASEELAGRYPGTPEDEELTAYLVGQFKQAGLELHEKTGIQYFELPTSIENGENMHAAFNGEVLTLDSDYAPFPFSASGTAQAPLVFAGFGFHLDEGSVQWDDYKDLDVTGKWVLMFRGVPGTQEASSPYFNYGEDRAKALLAHDMGAAGVVMVSGPGYDAKDQLVQLKGKQHPLPIPVIHVSRACIDRFLEEGDSVAGLEEQVLKRMAPLAVDLGISAKVQVDLRPKNITTANTLGYLPGADPLLAGQYVLIGAHHDHLGMGGPGTSSRAPDTVAVHYGADDNASGVTGVLEIAEKMVAQEPARSMLFASFGAEEMGLVGSKYLSENAPIDLGQVQVMINLDMVGRLKEDRQLQIGGVGTSPGLQALLESLNASYGFTLKFANEGFGPSDHAAFYAKDVPVLFISTGAHPDYHTPSDGVDAINLEGMQEVLNYVSDVALALANAQDRLAFTEAGPKVRGSSRGRRGGITLGLMPDVTYDGNDGMPVMFVTEGKPAAVGGVQKGDVIVSIEGLSVGNVYDYMARLDGLKEGMDIVVKVKRGEDQLELVVRI